MKSSLFTTIAAGSANNSQAGEECIDENTELEDPDQAKTPFLDTW